MTNADRKYDLVLLGATGYTGKFTAEHIQQAAPTDLKWAIAGRNLKKLDEVAQQLKELNGDRQQPEIEIAEQNYDDLDALAKKTRVLITAVGPYWRVGSPVVEACAKNGTHYLDVTGEVVWVLDMIQKWHEVAKKNECLLLPQCGFDSVPSDILAYLLVSHIRKTLGEGVKECINSVQFMSGKLSGGTSQTLLTIREGYGLKEMVAAYQPFALSPVPGPKQRPEPRLTKMLGIKRVPELGLLGTAPQNEMDRAIVGRSWGLFDGGEFYGKQFRFRIFLRMKSFLRAALWHIMFVTFAVGLQIPPIVWICKRFAPAPGTGPTKEQSKDYGLRMKALAVSDSGKKAVATLEWDGNGYDLTGVTVAQAAFEILYGSAGRAHKLGGAITPACLEMSYVDRLEKAGIRTHVSML